MEKWRRPLPPFSLFLMRLESEKASKSISERFRPESVKPEDIGEDVADEGRVFTEVLAGVKA